MAGEVYKLSLLLEASDRASGKLNTLSNALRKLRTESQAAGKTYGKMRADIEKPMSFKSGAVTSGIKAIIRNAETAEQKVSSLNRRLDTLNRRGSRIGNLAAAPAAAPATDVRSTRNARSRGRTNIDEARNELDRVMDEDARTRPRSRAVRMLQRGAALNDNVIDPIRGVSAEWRNSADALKTYTSEATRLIRSQAQLKIIGLTPGEQAQALQFIDKVGRDIRGVSKIDVTSGMVDAIGAFGDVQQAGRFLPSMMKYKMNLGAFFGDTMSKDQQNRQMLSSAKALEYIGVTQKGEAETDKWLQEFVRISASTGGRVLPEDILTMLRRGKVATRGLTPEGLRASASLIEDFGAPTAGTAMMSLYQQLVGGVMKESAVALFQKYGLLKEGGFEFKKGTTVAKKVKPGGNILGELMQSNPMEAGKVFLEKLRAGGVDTDNQKELREIMAVMFQNRNAFAYMDSLVNQRLQIEKEAQRMGVSADTLAQQRLLDIDTDLNRLKQLQEFEAQYENFKISIGQNLLPASNKILENITPVMQWIGDNPNAAAWGAGLIVAAKGLSLLGTTSSLLVNGTSLVSWFTNSGAAASQAATNYTRAGQAAAQARNAITSRFSAPVPIAFTVGAIIGLEYAIQKNVEGYLAARESENNLQKSIKTSNKVSDRFHNEVGQPYKIQQRTDLNAQEKTELIAQRNNAVKMEASAVFATINRSNDLLQSLRVAGYQRNTTGFTEAAADNFKRLFGMHSFQGRLGGYDKSKTIETFRREGDALKNVDVMREFIRTVQAQIAKSDAKPEQKESARNEIFDILKAVQPAVFDQARAQLNNEGLEQMKQAAMAAMNITSEQAAQVVQMMQQGAQAQNQAQTDFANQLLGLSQPVQSTAQALTMLPDPTMQTANALGLLPPPTTDAANQMGTLANATNQVPGPMTSVASSANNAAGSLDGFSAKIANFQMPVPNIQTFSIGVPALGGAIVNRGGGQRRSNAPATQRKSSFNIFGGAPASVLFPSKASGGYVKKDGFAEIHAGEMIVPASVTRKYQEPETFAMLRRTRSADSDALRNRELSRLAAPVVTRAIDVDSIRENAREAAANGGGANLDHSSSIDNARRTFRNFDVGEMIRRSNARAARNSTGGQSSAPAQVTIHAPLSVTIHGGGDAEAAKDQFAAQLEQHLRLIEHKIARSLDRGRERD